MKQNLGLLPILLLCTLTISAQTTYRFTGNGYWSDTSNWAGNQVPPRIIPEGSVIEIMPAIDGACLLDVQVIVPRTASLVIGEGRKFRIFTDLILQQSADDYRLSTSDVELLDSSHIRNPALDQLIGAEGTALGRRSQPLQTTGYREQLLNQLLNYAWQCSEAKFTVTHPGNDSTAPTHNGFAYSYGNINIQKDMSARHYPDGGDSLHNAFMVFGTDCSGFLYNLFAHAGLQLQPVPTVLSMEPALNLALSNHTPYRHVHVRNLGRIPAGEIQSGDILIWKNKGHAGLAGKLLNQETVLFHAHGQPRPLTERGWKIKPQPDSPATGLLRTAQEEQSENLGMIRGIHSSSLSRLMTDTGWASRYEVLRLEEDSTFTDPRDGQVYSFARIGTQVWMTRNLNYLNGNAWYYHNHPANRAIYGLLYDWQSASTAVPPGWHLPTLAEWYTLVQTLGGEPIAGGKMKSRMLWESPNIGATDSSGFHALPGGLGISGSQYESIGTGAFWWTATQYSVMGQPLMAWYYSLVNYTARGFSWYEDKTLGFSVRCVRD